MPGHALHIEVGKAFDKLALKYGLIVLKDDACYDPIIHAPHLQFFLTSSPIRETCVSKADIIIIKANEVRLVCEIEESGFNPTKIYGKVFSAATTQKSKVGNALYNVSSASDGIFVQIISSEKMNAFTKNESNSKKSGQFGLLSKKINDILKNAGLWINKYYILCDSPGNFRTEGTVYDNLEEIIKHI